MSQVAWPESPALFETHPASAGRRVARGLLSAVVTLAAGAGLSWLGISLAGRSFTGPETVLVAASLTGPVAVVFACWGAFAGGWLPDLLLGLRTVGVADGRRAVPSGLARAGLLGVLGLATAGLAPLLLTLLTRDRAGRVWVDRLTGTAVIDVRHGRNVLARPVTAAELEAAFLPKRPPRPAIIEVSPERPGPAAEPYARQLDASGGPFATGAGGASGVTRPAREYGASVEGSPTRVAAPVAPAAVAPTTVWLLSFDTGEKHLLHGSAVIGRQPAPQPGVRGAELIRIQDPSRTVSGSHLVVVGNDLGVWVEDLGSTNGSEVLSPNGRSQALAVRVRTAVAGGARVRLGDRWMRVERAAR